MGHYRGRVIDDANSSQDTKDFAQRLVDEGRFGRFESRERTGRNVVIEVQEVRKEFWHDLTLQTPQNKATITRKK